jgi:hypothetical protein
VNNNTLAALTILMFIFIAFAISFVIELVINFFNLSGYVRSACYIIAFLAFLIYMKKVKLRRHKS